MPLAARSESAVHDPLVVKELAMELPAGCRASERASFKRAHASRALPKELAAVDSSAKANLYCFAVARRSP